MVRWFGLILLLVAVPLFSMIRDGPFKIRSPRGRTRTGNLLFVLGFVGFTLFLFGGVAEAVVFLAMWGFVAWAYNL
jgi:hypothetical protein